VRVFDGKRKLLRALKQEWKPFFFFFFFLGVCVASISANTDRPHHAAVCGPPATGLHLFFLSPTHPTPAPRLGSMQKCYNLCHFSLSISL